MPLMLKILDNQLYDCVHGCMCVGLQQMYFNVGELQMFWGHNVLQGFLFYIHTLHDG